MENRIAYQDRYINYAHVSRPAPKTDYPTIAFEAMMIYLNIRGEKKALIEGNTYSIHPGDFFIIQELEAFRVTEVENGSSEFMRLIFSRSVLRYIDPDFRLVDKFVNRKLGESNLIRPDERFFSLFIECVKHIDMMHEDYQLRSSIFGTLLILLNEIDQCSVYRAPDESNTGFEIIRHINEHLTEELTLEALSQKFYMSTSQFYRTFKKLTGTTLLNYLTIKRVIMARNLIRNRVKVKDAVRMAGFNEYTTFYKANIKYFKCPPSAERPNEENDPLLLRGFYQV